MEDMKKYENMTVQEKWSILATVANLYYNSEMTQNEIADRMYTSRSKISRMLKEARELGIVEISIKEPWERDLNLEKEIQQTYGVKTVRAVSSRDISKEQITSRLSEVSAYYLDSVVKEKMVVGISWGNTLYHIVKYIDATNRALKVIPDKKERIKFILASYNAGLGHISDAMALARKYGKNELVWEHNVEKFILLKSNEEYFTDPVCKNGYFRGIETYNFVRDILSRYEVYKQKIKK